MTNGADEFPRQTICQWPFHVVNKRVINQQSNAKVGPDSPEAFKTTRTRLGERCRDVWQVFSPTTFITPLLTSLIGTNLSLTSHVFGLRGYYTQSCCFSLRQTGAHERRQPPTRFTTTPRNCSSFPDCGKYTQIWPRGGTRWTCWSLTTI